MLWRQAPAGGTVCAKGGNNDTGAGGGWFKPTAIRFVTGEINSLDKKLTRDTYLKIMLQVLLLLAREAGGGGWPARPSC